MRVTKYLAILLATTFLALPSFGTDTFSFIDPETEGQGISPEEQALIGGGINEADFNSAIDEHKTKFDNYEVGDKKGLVQSFGATWTIAKLWSNNTKNANASKRGSKWHINMYGGLARYNTITKDGFALVLCHEMGHLVGGFPAYGSGSREKLMADEGNSDYYATYACAEFLWADQEELNAKARDVVKPAAKAFCDKVYPEDEDDQNLCYRKVNGSEGLAKFLNGGKDVSFDKPDTKKVSKTSHRHPRGQCRLDTYMAGAACKKYEDWKHEAYPANEKEMNEQSCSGSYPNDATAVKEQGLRPRCWFAPR